MEVRSQVYFSYQELITMYSFVMPTWHVCDKNNIITIIIAPRDGLRPSMGKILSRYV